MKKFTYGALAFALTPLAFAANAAAQEAFNISIGVRESDATPQGPIGANSGIVAGSIEYVARDGRTLVADGTWQFFTFNFGTDPVNFFAGSPQPTGGAANQLDGPGGYGTLEQIRFRNNPGTLDPIRFYVDDVVNTVGGVPHVITDFEAPVLPTNAQVLFRQPSFSGSSTIAPPPSPNIARLTNTFVHSGAQAYEMSWAFGNTVTTNALRLTTNATANAGNPIINFSSGNSLSFWALAVVDHPLSGWITDGDGNWNNGANWAGAVIPNTGTSLAKFGANAGLPDQPVTVTVDAATTTNNIQFDNLNSYTIAGTNALTFNSTNTFPATIGVTKGNHTISAPILFNNAAPTGFQNISIFMNRAEDTLALGTVEKDAGSPNPVGVAKNGPGKVTITGLTVEALSVTAGSFDVLAGGAVALSHDSVADPTRNSLTVSTGAVLNVGGASLSANTALSNGTINHTAGASTLGVVTGSGTLNVSGGSFAAASLQQSTINLTAGSIEVLPSGAPTTMLRTNNLTAAAGTLLDMNDNDMIVNYTGTSPEFDLRDKVLLYRNGAGTEGIGFTETVAEDTILAFGEASELAITSFNGIAVDTTTIVGKYTYYGDGNLDGQVTTDDYVAVDLGLGTGDSWVQGDFDLNGSVTTDDYVVVDLNLGKGTTNPLAFADEQARMIALHTEMFGQSYVEKLAYASEFGWVAASVPEPGALSLVGLGATALLGRRRRNK